MTPTEPTYCDCGDHLIDPSNHRSVCPVCLDRQAKNAEAAAALLGWQVYGTGGAA